MTGETGATSAAAVCDNLLGKETSRSPWAKARILALLLTRGMGGKPNQPKQQQQKLPANLSAFVRTLKSPKKNKLKGRNLIKSQFSYTKLHYSVSDQLVVLQALLGNTPKGSPTPTALQRQSTTESSPACPAVFESQNFKS